MLAWVDIETTGLDPAKGSMLEIALNFTDDDLQPIAMVDYVIKPTVDYRAQCDAYVTEMHTRNGLFSAVEAIGFALELVQQDLIRFAAQWGGDAKKVPLCGSSIHFDRAWLKVHMPQLEAAFHYRNVDVSTIKLLCDRWAPRVSIDRPRPDEIAHRAGEDILASINELRYYKKFFLRGVPGSQLELAL